MGKKGKTDQAAGNPDEDTVISDPGALGLPHTAETPAAVGLIGTGGDYCG